MILYLLRHGDAIRDARLLDIERPLSDLGRQQAAAAGRFVRAGGTIPEILLCSPLLRAQQTAAGVLSETGSLPVRTTEHLSSSSDPRHILRELGVLSKERVLLVGHEPHLSTTISVLLSGDERSRVLMKPCSLACLCVTTPPENDKALLQWLIHAEHMLGA